MIKYEVTNKAVAYICDRCKKEYSDPLDTQEFHRIRFRGGYASVFGDDVDISCDICQHCLKDLIGDFCVVGGVTNGRCIDD